MVQIHLGVTAMKEAEVLKVDISLLSVPESYFNSLLRGEKFNI